MDPQDQKQEAASSKEDPNGLPPDTPGDKKKDVPPLHFSKPGHSVDALVRRNSYAGNSIDPEVPRGAVDTGDGNEAMASPKESPCGSEKSGRLMLRIPSAEQLSYTEGTYVPSRVERLLAERQMRRSSTMHSSSSIATLGSTDDLSNRDSVEDLVQLSMEMTGRDKSENDLKGRGDLQRILIVANRLPVTVSRDPDNEGWRLEAAAGGLVSALMGVKRNYQTQWIGWVGFDTTDEREKDELRGILAERGCIPVFLERRTQDLYYNGFSNNVLWPLFHYISLKADLEKHAETLNEQWTAYQRANAEFARTVMQNYQEGDIVWCHDYHLMLMPEYLKAVNPGMKLGWFLHTPFPSSEIYRTLPMRGDILSSLVKADMVGFHTYDYARHFVSACTRILGLEGTPVGVEDSGRVTRVAAFPIGIDPQRFWTALKTPQVREKMAELQRQHAGKKIMLGVDRLDMIKGIPQKLLGVEKFLIDHPEWRDKVVLVQIAVPSRQDVPEYQRLGSQVHEMIGRINGRFATLSSNPIHYLERNVEFYELCALYALTDVALVTSLRDGMNLVSYEYVACQVDQQKGVLMLSEFAGAAQSLGAGALLVNPWNVEDMALGIMDALTMSDVERKERHKQNCLYVMRHTAQAWADTFVSELNDTQVEMKLRKMHLTTNLVHQQAIDCFARHKRRLVILGFNATLTTSAKEPTRKKLAPQLKRLAQVDPLVMNCLRKLADDPSVVLVVFSGSECNRLEEALGSLNIWLAAENGVYLKPPGRAWMPVQDVSNSFKWMESVQLVYDYFCERTPRSYVENRETSMVWNYKYSDPDFGKVQARDLLQHLWTGPISNAAVDVVQGSKSVEVRPVGVSKGAALDRIIAEVSASKKSTEPDCTAPIADMVFVCGHFLSKDEDIFTYFEPDPYQEREDEEAHAHADREALDNQELPGEEFPRVNVVCTNNELPNLTVVCSRDAANKGLLALSAAVLVA
mmetsp:Transcript_12478/g.45483  ORF Transcript_12478/g.45483 Transcript_12478/m.45483 type:complete len:973 (+) Transcript_12478:181-3099(+)